jgi:ribose-phosphate pyrophosphokinase
MDKIVVVGPASQSLAFKVAQLLNAPTIHTETKTFPDGENYLRLVIEDESIIAGKDVIVIQTLGASALGKQNQRFMELIMMISAVKRMGAAKCRVVVPYMAYARQSKVYRPGESIFANDVCRMIQSAGATEFYVVDVHHPGALKAFTIPHYNLKPMKLLALELKRCGVTNPVVICPDAGALQRSNDLVNALGEGAQIVQFEKHRDPLNGQVSMAGTMPDNVGAVIIADDIIATGGTMAKAIEIAKQSGAEKIYAVGTHAILIGNAVYTLLEAGVDKIIGTDTMDTYAYQVSMAELIGEALVKHDDVYEPEKYPNINFADEVEDESPQDEPDDD